jgi:hypothetical protein
MQSLRAGGWRVLLLVCAIVALAALLCGGVFWLVLEQPYLTWQHSAEFVDPMAAYVAEIGLPADSTRTVRIMRVREYTPTCSVIRTAITTGAAERVLWVRLLRADEASGWAVDFIESDAGPGGALRWGAACGTADDPLLPDLPVPLD